MANIVNHSAVFLYIHNSDFFNCLQKPNFTAFRNYVYTKLKTGTSKKLSISLSLYQLIIYIIYIIYSSFFFSLYFSFFYFLRGGEIHGKR